jgi:hypothetical protein
MEVFKLEVQRTEIFFTTLLHQRKAGDELCIPVLIAETIPTPSGRWLRCVRYDGNCNFGALHLN